MIARRATLRLGLGVLALAGGWLLFVALPDRYAVRREPAAAPNAPAPAATVGGVRRITATLYYVADDGMALMPVQREVPFGATVAEQARAIIEAQLAPAPPLVSALPRDTTLRDVFVTERRFILDQVTARIMAEPDAVPAFLEAARTLLGMKSRARTTRDILERASCPVLLIHGDRDLLVPFAAAESVARSYPRWTFSPQRGLGHAIQMEAPDRWLTAVNDWLTGAF